MKEDSSNGDMDTKMEEETSSTPLATITSKEEPAPTEESQQPLEDDLDDGELSDASTASTIPLEEDHDYRTNMEVDDHEATPATSFSTTNAKKTAEVITTSKEDMLEEKQQTMDANDKQMEVDEESEIHKPSSEAGDSQNSDDNSKQSKPTKIKLSLQEYLSRRAANQDGPSNESHSEKEQEVKLCSSSTATTTTSTTTTAIASSDLSMEKEQPEAIVNQH